MICYPGRIILEEMAMQESVSDSNTEKSGRCENRRSHIINMRTRESGLVLTANNVEI